MRDSFALARVAFCMIAFASNGACLRSTEFHCTQDGECSQTGAKCEGTGFCSFTDSSCMSGRRYGEFAGSLSNQCVDGMMSDGGTDGPDGMSGGCPTGYATLPNAGTHKYKKIGNAAAWSTQRDRCTADAPGGATYLAVPDDMAEATAIVTLGAATTWVGINDATTEMSYVTVLGGAATFLPWDTAAGEPNDTGTGGNAQDCVAAQNISGLFMDDKCSTAYIGVCECNGP